MAENPNKPLLVVIAFLLPLLFVLVVLLVSILPSASLSSDYDFLYTGCRQEGLPYSGYCAGFLQHRYSIIEGRLQQNELPADLDSDGDDISDIDEGYNARIFYHDSVANVSREISLDQARSYLLSDLLTSPEGITVELQASRGGGFFPFYSYSSDTAYYFTRGNASKRLNLIGGNNASWYRGNFRFLGWVLEP